MSATRAQSKDLAAFTGRRWQWDRVTFKRTDSPFSSRRKIFFTIEAGEEVTQVLRLRLGKPS
jgi:hypothetical protein